MCILLICSHRPLLLTHSSNAPVQASRNDLSKKDKEQKSRMKDIVLCASSPPLPSPVIEIIQLLICPCTKGLCGEKGVKRSQRVYKTKLGEFHVLSVSCGVKTMLEYYLEAFQLFQFNNCWKKEQAATHGWQENVSQPKTNTKRDYLALWKCWLHFLWSQQQKYACFISYFW